jgi:hypothetical protein
MASATGEGDASKAAMPEFYPDDTARGQAAEGRRIQE